MKHPFKLGLLSLAIAQAAFAEDIPTYIGDEIVVTATRTPQPAKSLLSDITVIPREEISKAGQSTLVELLQSQPGMEITQSGGMGTDSGVFIRGANNSHTLVLVDGLRLDSATLGTTALQAIPLNQIDHIEILRGPASSLYGSDAIGGVIQIFTKTGQGAPKANFSAGVGTYNTQSVSGGFSGQMDNTRFNLQAGYLSSGSFSTIGNAANKDYNSDRDGYRNTNFSANMAQTIQAGHEIGFTAFNSNGAVHYDASYPSPASFDYRSQQTVSAYSVYSKNRFLPDWSSQLRFGVGTDDSRTFLTPAAASKIRTDQNQLNWQNDITTQLGNVTLGVERLLQKVSGDTAYAVTQRTIQSYLAGYQGRFGNQGLQLNARHDVNSQFGNHDTGSLSYGYQINPEWRASASLGTAYKAPTFNGLYWPASTYAAGNPNLVPEKSRSKEVSIHYDTGMHHFSMVYFDNQISNLIDWAQTSPGFYQPSNINQARITGTTLSYQGLIAGYRIRANLDLQDPEDNSTGLQLQRRSKEHAALAVSRRTGAWDWGAELTASGTRFNDTANKIRMGGYGLVNLSTGYQIDKEWSVRGRINNVFNKRYELVRDYNTPGANLFVGVQYQPR